MMETLHITVAIIATNPQMFFDIELDVPEAERLATVELIKEDIGKVMDDYKFMFGYKLKDEKEIDDEL